MDVTRFPLEGEKKGGREWFRKGETEIGRNLFLEFFYRKYRLENAIADTDSSERCPRRGFSRRRGRKRRKFSREKCNCRFLARCCDSCATHSASLNGIQGAKVSVQRSASNGFAARREIIYEPSN